MFGNLISEQGYFSYPKRFSHDKDLAMMVNTIHFAYSASKIKYHTKIIDIKSLNTEMPLGFQIRVGKQ